MVNQKRIIDRFCEFVSIDSESLNERNMGDHIKEIFKEFSDEIIEDNAGEKIGGNCGNIIVKIKGRTQTPILLTAHLDTVKPGNGIKPVIENDRIVSAGNTVLGADDKSGIAMILEALETAKEEKIDIPSLEIVFTVAEEIGLLGAKNVDSAMLSAKYGIALDSEDIDSVYNRAPSQYFINMSFYGKTAHAGMAPENGLNAILMASSAITKMPLGRIDTETTANIGIIEGGIATNIIPEKVVVKGEVRSHDEDKLEYYKNKIKESAYESVRNISEGKGLYGNVTIEEEKVYDRIFVRENSKIVNILKESFDNAGIKMLLKTGGGGSDANIFNGYGIETVIMGTGMQEVHTVNEYIKISDLIKGAEILLEFLKRWDDE